MAAPTELTEVDRQALTVIDSAVAAVAAYGRDDLRESLDLARLRVTEPEFVIVVAGEFKKGKSTLTNAMVDAEVCPVDDDIATSVPTSIRHGDDVAAVLITGDSAADIQLEEAAGYIVQSTETDVRPDLVEITVPRRLLADGLVVVDTPGVGGLDSKHGAATLGALAFADAVVFVTDASQELTAPEIEFLGHADRLCQSLLCVVTKIDFYPQWRRMAAADQQHIRDAGIQAEVIPVSSPIRVQALRTGSKDLDHESGFDSLMEWVRGVESERSRAAARDIGLDVVEIAAQLSAPFEAERSVLTDPAKQVALLQELDEARRRADRLKSGGARWQHALSDGVADLASDVMFDLKTRMGEVIEQADELIDNNAPSSIWDELEALTERAVREAVVANFEVLRNRTDDLISMVDVHFEDGASEIRDITNTGPAELTDLKLGSKASGSSFAGAVGGALTGLRGSYSGMLMFNMLGGILGLAAIAPVTMVLGVFMGGKAVRGERKRQLTVARQSARQSIRKYVDAAAGQSGKETQDSLKRIQRSLRDYYGERARRYQLSTTAALSAAQNALRSAGDSTPRIADLDAEIQRIDALRQQAHLLVQPEVRQ